MADAQNENSGGSALSSKQVENTTVINESKIGDGPFCINSDTLENVDLNLDGDVEDAGSSADSSGEKVVIVRPKRKVKRKRKSRSLQHSTEENDSSSDSDCYASYKTQNDASKVNPKDLNWTMWFWYYIVAVSVGAFHVAEYMGEKLADFFGITTPKYQYVIDEYYRMKQEEKEEKEREEREQQQVLRQEAEKISLVEGGDKGDLKQV